jgi:hypothetical protein
VTRLLNWSDRKDHSNLTTWMFLALYVRATGERFTTPWLSWLGVVMICGLSVLAAVSLVRMCRVRS